MTLYLKFLLLGCFWGGSFIAIKFAIASVPFSIAVFLRILIGLCVLFGACLLLKKPLTLPKKVLPWVWLNGLFSIGLPFLFLFWAEEHVSAGLAGIMNGTVPIWTALLGLMFLKEYERASWRKMVGVFTGLLGVVVIFAPSLQMSESRQMFLGLLALWMMALLYASGTLMAKQLISGKSKVPVIAAALHQHLASSVLVGLYLVFTGQSFAQVDWQMRPVVALFYMGICSTGLAFLIFFDLVSKWGAVRASTVTYLIPTVCLILDYFVFGNTPHLNQLVGIGIVFSGIFLVQRS